MPNANVPIRPINKGIIRNLPSQALPDGALVDAVNFNVTTNGLKVRGGFKPLYRPLAGSTTGGLNNIFNAITGDVQNTFLFEQNDGQKELLTVTNEALYKMRLNKESYDRVHFGGEIDIFGLVMGVTTVELKQIIDPLFTGAYVEEGGNQLALALGDYIIYGVEVGQIVDLQVDATYNLITVEVDTPANWSTATGLLEGELNFGILQPYKIDHALVNGIDNNKVVFSASRGGALLQYDITGILSPVAIDSTSAVDPQFDIDIEQSKVCQWYRNRLWIANTVEDGKVLRQRIRWSDATTYLDFDSADRFRPENYIDLSDSMGEVLAILPMGEILMVYCSDAVYYGRATNQANLPYTFTKINTPNIGLVGQSAITQWIDGHYFVGQDDIYFVSAAQSIQELGTAILPISLDLCYNKAGIDVRPDPENSRILFLFPEDFSSIATDLNDLNAATKIFGYNYKTGAWSYIEASYVDTPTGKDYAYYFSSISSSMLFSGSTFWTDYIALDPGNTGAYDWGDWELQFNRWDALKDGQLTDHTVLFGLTTMDTVITQWVTDSYVEVASARDDVIGLERLEIGPNKVLVSADYDYNVPDDNKQVNRFTVKLEDHVIFDTTFTAYVSIDRGRTYKPVGTLLIKAGKDEGKVNFRAKGSTFRFKLESTDLYPNTINEFVVRVSQRGKEN
jgi:hypothetical protein